MKFKRLYGMTVLAAVSLSQLPCFAQGSDIEAVYDAKTEAVTVKGTAYGNAVITIFKYGEEPGSYSDTNMPPYVRQTEFSGDFTYKIPMPDGLEGGKYVVYVTTADSDGSAVFVHMDSSSAAEALQALNSAASAAELKAAARENAAALGIDLEDADYIRVEDRIYELLFSMKYTYTEPYEFNNTYYKMLAAALLEDANADTCGAVLKKYAEQLGIVYETDIAGDKRLTDSARTELFGLLAGIDYKNEFEKRKAADFSAILEEYKAVSAVKTAEGWQNLKKTVEEDFAYTKAFCDSDEYKKVKDKDAIYTKAMSGARGVGTPEGVMSVLKSAAQKQASEEKGSDGSGSGSGSGTGSGSGGSSGGSSGSGGGKVSVPISVNKPDTTENLMFGDVPTDFWGYTAITALGEKKLISGYEDGSFKPKERITRAEFVKLVLGLYEIIAPDAAKDGAGQAFADVNEGDWYYDAVTAAAAAGLVSGSDGLFRPQESITREDAAVIMQRTISSVKELFGNYIFTDRNEISAYARDAVGVLAANGYISGVSEGIFSPKDNLTRAQAAQLIYNAQK